MLVDTGNAGERDLGRILEVLNLAGVKQIDLWQLHWSYWGGVEHNAPGVMIGNIDEPAQLAAVVGGPAAPGQATAAPPAGPGGNANHSPAYHLKVTARTDGSFTVTNSRNGYSRTYPTP